jgi:chromosome segregation ATPase
MTDKTQVKVYLPSELHKRLKADPRTNSKAVKDALKTEFQTEDEAAVRRRIDEKERRISNVKSERNSRNQELERLQNELESLKQQLKTSKELKDERQEAIDRRLESYQDVQGVIDESHPTVEALAQEHFSGSREQALEAMQERNNELELVPSEYL